ncbi:hypothetical protein [Paracoccus sp. T5]
MKTSKRQIVAFVTFPFPGSCSVFKNDPDRVKTRWNLKGIGRSVVFSLEILTLNAIAGLVDL